MRVRKLLHSCATIEAEPFRRKLLGRDLTWGPVCLAVAELVDLSSGGRASADNVNTDDFACLPKPKTFRACGGRGRGRGRASGRGASGNAGHDDAIGVSVPARLASGNAGTSPGSAPPSAAELQDLAATHFDDADPDNPEAESSSSASSSEPDEVTPESPEMPTPAGEAPLPALGGFDALLAKHGIEDEGGELFIGVAPFRTHLGRMEYLNSRCLLLHVAMAQVSAYKGQNERLSKVHTAQLDRAKSAQICQLARGWPHLCRSRKPQQKPGAVRLRPFAIATSLQTMRGQLLPVARLANRSTGGKRGGGKSVVMHWWMQLTRHLKSMRICLYG